MEIINNNSSKYYSIITVFFRLKLMKFSFWIQKINSQKEESGYQSFTCGKDKSHQFCQQITNWAELQKSYTGLTLSQVADGPGIWVQPSVLLNGGEKDVSTCCSLGHQNPSVEQGTVSGQLFPVNFQRHYLWEKTFLPLLDLERKGSRMQRI